MHTENLVLHQGSNREVVEKVREVPPHCGVAVFSHALVVKPIHLSDLSGLVIAPSEGNAITVSYLETE